VVVMRRHGGGPSSRCTNVAGWGLPGLQRDGPTEEPGEGSLDSTSHPPARSQYRPRLPYPPPPPPP
jgi:hypothetical protein